MKRRKRRKYSRTRTSSPARRPRCDIRCVHLYFFRCYFLFILERMSLQTEDAYETAEESDMPEVSTKDNDQRAAVIENCDDLD